MTPRPSLGASPPDVYHRAYGSRVDLDFFKVSFRQLDPRNMRMNDVKATTCVEATPPRSRPNLLQSVLQLNYESSTC